MPRISILLFSFLLCCLAPALPAQKLLEAKLVLTLSPHQLDSIREASHIPARLAPVHHAVSVYDVLYFTAWADGSPVLASGFVLLPEGAKAPMPLLGYNHGTRLKKNWNWGLQGEEIVCAFFAADGYAVAMPDYVGLRRGERNHLYHHAATEALATVDLLRATQELLQHEGLEWNKQLFLTGYSQGGHAAMATHKYIQERLHGEFKVTASAPMSGAYDLVGVQGQVLNRSYEQPGYLPYLLFSFQAAYHLMPDSADFFQPPYDTLLPRLYDGYHGFRDVNPHLPSVPSEMLKPALLEAFQADSTHPLRRIMAENSLTEWAPEAPMLLCYCKSDEQVSYQNSLVAAEQMEALGSHAVQLRHAGRKFSHGPCAIFTAIYARMWFDSIREGHSTGKKGPLWDRFLINMSKMAIRRK